MIFEGWKLCSARRGAFDSCFDFLGYRFKRSRRGRMVRLIRPESLSKLRDSIKPRTRRNNGKCMNEIVADLNLGTARLVRLLQTRQSQRTGRDRRVDPHEIAVHPTKTAWPGRPWSKHRSPTLAQPLLHETRVRLPAGRSEIDICQSPSWSKPLTGEPDAGMGAKRTWPEANPPVRFGRGSGAMSRSCLDPIFRIRKSIPPPKSCPPRRARLHRPPA
jgi:hypothetical protein